MPNSLQTYKQLQEDTRLSSGLYAVFADQYQFPDFSRLQTILRVLREWNIPDLPDPDNVPSSTENHHLLMGAVFYLYFSLSECNEPLSNLTLIFLQDISRIDPLNTPDSHSIVLCCRAYQRFLWLNGNPGNKHAYLDELVKRHIPEYVNVQTHLDYLGFLQSFLLDLDAFTHEMDNVIEELRPLTEKWSQENGSLDFFDISACLQQTTASPLAIHMMEEYCIPDTGSDWEKDIREQLDENIQHALVGAYVFVLAQTCPERDINLHKTLRNILSKINYKDDRDKNNSLNVLAAFVFKSSLPQINVRAWNTRKCFIEEFTSLCHETGTGLVAFRRNDLIRTETKKLYTIIMNMVRNRHLVKPQFRLINDGTPISNSLFKNMLTRLRYNHFVPGVTFLEGLLTEGRIQVAMEHASNPDAYLEQRIHDAICLYVHLANDKWFKPMVDYLLWEIRHSTPFDSVKSRLGRCDLSPSNRYYSNHGLLPKARQQLTPIRPLLFFKPTPVPEEETTRDWAAEIDLEQVKM